MKPHFILESQTAKNKFAVKIIKLSAAILHCNLGIFAAALFKGNTHEVTFCSITVTC